MTTDKEMSDYPEGSDDYYESDKVCPNCKDVLLWASAWWDDPVWAGGACIGTTYTCGDCGYYQNI